MFAKGPNNGIMLDSLENCNVNRLAPSVKAYKLIPNGINSNLFIFSCLLRIVHLLKSYLTSEDW